MAEKELERYTYLRVYERTRIRYRLDVVVTRRDTNPRIAWARGCLSQRNIYALLRWEGNIRQILYATLFEVQAEERSMENCLHRVKLVGPSVDELFCFRPFVDGRRISFLLDFIIAITLVSIIFIPSVNITQTHISFFY